MAHPYRIYDSEPPPRRIKEPARTMRVLACWRCHAWTPSFLARPYCCLCGWPDALTTIREIQ